MTLSDFLLARIAEDEAVARALDWLPPLVTDGSLPSVAPALTAHIARHDPARVLAECEAKRQIVLGAQDRERGAALAPAEDEMIAEARLTAGNLYDDVMRHLAAVYADHKDFREEWRP